MSEHNHPANTVGDPDHCPACHDRRHRYLDRKPVSRSTRAPLQGLAEVFYGGDLKAAVAAWREQSESSRTTNYSPQEGSK